MHMPERETPGSTATACATPMRRLSRAPIVASARVRRPKRSAAHSITPVPIRNAPTQVGSRSGPSSASRTARPTTARGSVARMTNVSSRDGGSPLLPALPAPAAPRPTTPRPTTPSAIAHHSARKTTSSASSVPTCTATSKATPGSSAPRIQAPRTKCPLLLTGRSSVTPCTTARTMTSRIDIGCAATLPSHRRTRRASIVSRAARLGPPPRRAAEVAGVRDKTRASRYRFATVP